MVLVVQLLNRRMREFDRSWAGMREKRDQLSQEQTEKFQEKTQMELDVSDLRGDVDEERSSRVGTGLTEFELLAAHGLLAAARGARG